MLVRAVFIAAAISGATFGAAHINDTTSIVLASCDSRRLRELGRAMHP